MKIEFENNRQMPDKLIARLINELGKSFGAFTDNEKQPITQNKIEIYKDKTFLLFIDVSDELSKKDKDNIFYFIAGFLTAIKF